MPPIRKRDEKGKKLSLSEELDRCETNKDASQEEIINYIRDEQITDVVTVGPGGYKPFHNGHLISVKTAIDYAKTLKAKPGAKVCVVINTSCAGRHLEEKKKSTALVIRKGTMFLLWNEFIQPTIDKLRGDIPVFVSWNHRNALYALNELKKMNENLNIHVLYSSDNIGQLEGIFKDDWPKEPTEGEVMKSTHLFLIKQEREGAVSGTDARQSIFDGNFENFEPLVSNIYDPEGYFERLKEIYNEGVPLKSKGGRRTRRRRKTKTRRRRQRKTSQKPRKNRKRTRKPKRRYRGE